MNERDALLEQLRDPVAPTVGWWPLAAGWWFLIVLLIVSVGLAVMWWVWRRRQRATAWQRAARRELALLRAGLADKFAGCSTQELLARSSVLARRVLLAVRPRAQVASLHGDAWLSALDDLTGGTRFSQGAGRLLADGPYRKTADPAPDALTELFDALDELVANAGRQSERDTELRS